MYDEGFKRTIERAIETEEARKKVANGSSVEGTINKGEKL